MPRGYHHLTQDERCQIWGLKKSGLTQRAIGLELGRDHATISREIQRNSGGRGYRYKQAHNKATERRHRASSVPRKMTPALWQLVEEKLAVGWSPEQIVGRQFILTVRRQLPLRGGNSLSSSIFRQQLAEKDDELSRKRGTDSHGCIVETGAFPERSGAASRGYGGHGSISSQAPIGGRIGW